MAFDIMEAVRKGKVKKGGFQEGWEEAMRAHNVPDWYIESLAKIGYLFPKAHAVAYVMMAFRIAWFKVHKPLAFYAAYFSIRAKALDATCMCQGMEVCKQKMKEIEAKDKDAAAVEEDMMVTLEVCYEFYLRGFTFETIDLYRSDATKFLMDEEKGSLLPPLHRHPRPGGDGGPLHRGEPGGADLHLPGGAAGRLPQGLQDPRGAAPGGRRSGEHA